MSALRYVVASWPNALIGSQPGPKAIVIDEWTGYYSQRYYRQDALALAEWLNEREAGYPPNPALVC